MDADFEEGGGGETPLQDEPEYDYNLAEGFGDTQRVSRNEEEMEQDDSSQLEGERSTNNGPTSPMGSPPASPYQSPPASPYQSEGEPGSPRSPIGSAPASPSTQNEDGPQSPNYPNTQNEDSFMSPYDSQEGSPSQRERAYDSQENSYDRNYPASPGSPAADSQQDSPSGPASPTEDFQEPATPTEDAPRSPAGSDVEMDRPGSPTGSNQGSDRSRSPSPARSGNGPYSPVNSAPASPAQDGSAPGSPSQDRSRSISPTGSNRSRSASRSRSPSADEGQRSRSGSPAGSAGARSRSPSGSPTRSQSGSPERSRSGSPASQRSRSRSGSQARSQSGSPARSRSGSPASQRSRSGSPRSRRSGSAASGRSRSGSPVRSRSGSPRSRSGSPARSRSGSPASRGSRSRSRSPAGSYRSRSRSGSRASGRSRSGSPASGRSRSRSSSGSRSRSQSPAGSGTPPYSPLGSRGSGSPPRSPATSEKAGSDVEKDESDKEDLVADIFGSSDEEEEFEGFGEADVEATARKKEKKAAMISDDEGEGMATGQAGGEPVLPELSDDENDQAARMSGKADGEEFVSDFDLMMMKKKEEMKKRRRKRKDFDLINDSDDLIADMINKMKVAAEEDRGLNMEKKPAIKKLQYLPTVVSQLKKADLHGAFLDCGILSTMTEWLAPLPDKSLPNLQIRSAFLKILTEFPNINSGALKTSGIGKAVMYLYKHPKEIKENKERAGKLINDWSRPLFNLTANYKSLSKEEREQRDYDQLPKRRRTSLEEGGKTPRKDLDKSLTGEQQALRPGDPGWIYRARVPLPSNKDYVIRPKWKTDEEESEEVPRRRVGGKKEPSRYEKQVRKFAEKKKNSKTQRAVTISIEGRHMAL